MNKFYITTPIYYVNASPHIGHAYTTIAADTLARYKKLKKDKVYFLTGTDEHGEKVKEAADRLKKSPQEFTDQVMLNFKELWQKLNIQYDDFIRTTEDRHKQVVQKIISTLYEKGDIYKAEYKGFYCMPCEGFWTQSQVKEAGNACPECGRGVEEIVEENYFFKLSQYEGWLKQHLKDNPDFIKPRIRYNEVKGFLENNTLEDLCITRPKTRVSWGIEFPVDTHFVIYVWFDALINYISAIGFGQDSEKFDLFWPADVHFIGKDIIRHHAVFWPIMVHALGIETPRMVFAHGWWKMDSQKMSKSRGNIVNPHEFIKQFGVDSFRYFLLREVSFGADGNFSWDAVTTRLNSDLANDLGNLVYRVLNMSEKYFEGKVSLPEKRSVPKVFEPFVSGEAFCDGYKESMDKVDFSGALEKVWKFIGVMNKYIEETKPWELKKAQKDDELHHFIWVLLCGIRIVAIYVWPVMPQSAEAILRQLGLSFDLDAGLLHLTRWESIDYTIKKENPLFPRIDVNGKN